MEQKLIENSTIILFVQIVFDQFQEDVFARAGWDFRVNCMWIWLVAGLVLVYLLIFANQLKIDASEKPQKKATSLQLGEIYDRYVDLFDEDDELLEEFLIIDLLDEEEEE